MVYERTFSTTESTITAMPTKQDEEGDGGERAHASFQADLQCVRFFACVVLVRILTWIHKPNAVAAEVPKRMARTSFAICITVILLCIVT